MRGAGFPADAVARDLRLGRGAARQDDHFQHVPHLARNLGLQHGASRDRAGFLEQGHRFQLTIGREHGIGAGELHQVDREAVPVGHRRLLDRPPALRRTQPTRHLARETGFRRRAEPCVRQRGPHDLGWQRERDLRGADVR